MKIRAVLIWILGAASLVVSNSALGGGMFGKNLDPTPIIEQLEAKQLTMGSDAMDLPPVKPISFFAHRTKESVFAHSFFHDGKGVYLSLYTKDNRIFAAVLIDTKRGKEKFYFYDSELMDQLVDASTD